MPARRQRKCILVIVDVIVVIVVIVDVIVVIVVIGVIVIVVIAIGGIVVVVIAATIHSPTRSGNQQRLATGKKRLPRGASVIYCYNFSVQFYSLFPFVWACSYCVNTGNWLARRRWQTHIKPDLNLRISLCNRHPAVFTALVVVLLLLTLPAGTANR
jgi:hypothetical protein